MQNASLSKINSESAKSIAEKRKLKRYSYNLKIFNQKTNVLLGYIENISVCGMLVKSLHPVADAKEIQVWFGSDKDDNQESRIDLTVRKVWGSVTEKEPKMYNTGLYFVGLSEPVLNDIQKLIDKLGR